MPSRMVLYAILTASLSSTAIKMAFYMRYQFSFVLQMQMSETSGHALGDMVRRQGLEGVYNDLFRILRGIGHYQFQPLTLDLALCHREDLLNAVILRIVNWCVRIK